MQLKIFHLKLSSKINVLLGFVLLIFIGTLLFTYRYTNSIRNKVNQTLNTITYEEAKQQLVAGVHTLSQAVSHILSQTEEEEKQVLLLQNIIHGIHFQDNPSLYYFAGKGTRIIAHGTNKSYIGKDFTNEKDKNGVYYIRQIMAQAINGGGFTEYFFNKPGSGTKEKISYSEMIPNTDYWLCLGIYKDTVELQQTHSFSDIDDFISTKFIFFLVFAIFGFSVSLVFIAIFLNNTFVRTIKRLNFFADNMKDGNLEAKMNYKYFDELGSLVQILIDHQNDLQKKNDVLQNFAQKKLDYQFQPATTIDSVGNTIQALRNTMLTTQSEEIKRREEEQLQAWINNGVTLFSETVRRDNQDIRKLSENVVRKFLEYLEINQGGLFIYKEATAEEPEHLELMATFAYNRIRAKKKKVYVDDGILGACMKEKQMVYLKNVPDDYIEITSGLGGTVPKTVLLVPLKNENQLMGVIELASFDMFKDYQIKFVEAVSTIIASTLFSVQLGQQTKILLEQSQIQANEMLQRESQLKQSLQDLDHLKQQLIIQDKRQKEQIELLNNDNAEKILALEQKEKRSKSILENSLDSVIIINTSGIIKFFNKTAEKFWGYAANEVLGQNVKILMPHNYAKEHDKYVSNYLETGRKAVIGIGRDIHILKKDGSIADAFLSLQEIESENGTEFMGFIKDLSKQKAEFKKQEIMLQKLISKEFELKSTNEYLKFKYGINQETKETADHENSHTIVTFNEMYHLGIKEIDNQHKRIIEMLNKLLQTFKLGNAEQTMLIELNELIDYTQYHFSYEEQLLERTGFPEAEQHADSHQLMLSKILTLRKDYYDNKFEVMYEILQILFRWATNHTTTLDSKYVMHLKRQGF